VKAGKLPVDPQPFAWRATFPQLLAPNAFTEIEKLVAEIERQMLVKWNVPLALIAVDTMAAGAGFQDEQSNSEGQRAMNVLAQLSARFKCCAVGIDHFGKVVENGTRGASAKEAAADAVLALLGERQLSGEVKDSRLAVRKTRNGGETGREIRFNAKLIELGVDLDGDPVTQRVIEWDVAQPGASASRAAARWGKKQSVLRKSLIAMLIERGRMATPYGAEMAAVRVVDLAILREEFDRNVVVDSPSGKEDDAKRKKFNRDLERAVADEVVTIRDNVIWVTLPEDERIVASGSSAWASEDDIGATPGPGASLN
jgi:hypothetical protein